MSISTRPAWLALAASRPRSASGRMHESSGRGAAERPSMVVSTMISLAGAADERRQALEHGIDGVVDARLPALQASRRSAARARRPSRPPRPTASPPPPSWPARCARARAPSADWRPANTCEGAFSRPASIAASTSVTLARRLAEEAPRRRLHAVGAGAEIDAVEVELEDVALAQAHLQPQRQDQLLELARPACAPSPGTGSWRAAASASSRPARRGPARRLVKAAREHAGRDRRPSA